jgi:hypothetical protein
MLTFALLMSARMGIFQETLYKQYGKHSKEALFYNVSVNQGLDDTINAIIFSNGASKQNTKWKISLMLSSFIYFIKL